MNLDHWKFDPSEGPHSDLFVYYCKHCNGVCSVRMLSGGTRIGVSFFEAIEVEDSDLRVTVAAPSARGEFWVWGWNNKSKLLVVSYIQIMLSFMIIRCSISNSFFSLTFQLDKFPWCLSRASQVESHFFSVKMSLRFKFQLYCCLLRYKPGQYVAIENLTSYDHVLYNTCPHLAHG